MERPRAMAPESKGPRGNAERTRTLLATAAAATLLATAATAAEPSTLPGAADLVPDWAATLWLRFEGWALDGYRRAPALMLGLAAALTIPPLAIAGFLIRSRRPPPAHTIDDVPHSIPLSAWQREAWIELLGDGGRRFDISRDLVRIGREEDNDLRLEDRSIHRYHAVIERTPELIFIIEDVSGAGDGSLRVAGEPKERARLRGGELIELGKTRLRFHVTAI